MMKFIAVLLLATAYASAEERGLGCTVCQTVVSIAGEFSDYSLPELENIMDSKCDKFGFFASFCKSTLKEYMPKVYELLHSELNNGQICSQIGLCDSLNAFAASFAKGQERGAIGCTVCQALVPVAQEFIDYSLPELTNQINKVCGKMGFFEAFCNSMVEQYLPKIHDLIGQELTGAEICNQVGLCSSRKRRAVPMEVEMERGIKCTVCKTLMGFVRELANYSEPEVQSILSEKCGKLGFFATFCKDTVNKYLPAMMTFLNEDVTDEQVCQKVTLC